MITEWALKRLKASYISTRDSSGCECPESVMRLPQRVEPCAVSATPHKFAGIRTWHKDGAHKAREAAFRAMECLLEHHDPQWAVWHAFYADFYDDRWRWFKRWMGMYCWLVGSARTTPASSRIPEHMPPLPRRQIPTYRPRLDV